MRGYILTQETKKNQALIMENEQIEAHIARIQTQSFLTKIETTKKLVFKEKQRFVIVPVRLTAKK